ncbi:fructosamine kinase family protein [Betaproteobacteria bacterium SCN2]|jgi:fructosamine-3-kinase|nr:fructosamine kinase family protein [Betaproteobacteria bacterium SCN2]
MRDFAAVEAAISAAIAVRFRVESSRPLGGGCINQAHLLEGCGQRYFLKSNRAALADMFAAEARGLAELEAAQALRVPHPVATGSADGASFLVLEYLQLGSGGDSAALGRQLARQHRKVAPAFGWDRDNTIGSTPQINVRTDDWPAFLRDRRLGFQLRLAEQNGLDPKLQDLGAQLLARLGEFFAGYRPAPSLLHGDLWGGNAAFTTSGEPVVFDPAVYYGDREADLAMTELFGGFDPRFYAAYREAWPLDPGYATRKTLYNLYHVLNHANLFGGGYVGQAESMLRRLLAELG